MNKGSKKKRKNIVEKIIKGIVRGRKEILGKINEGVLGIEDWKEDRG